MYRDVKMQKMKDSGTICEKIAFFKLERIFWLFKSFFSSCRDYPLLDVILTYEVVGYEVMNQPF